MLFFSILTLALDWELPLVLMAFLVDHLIVAQAPVDILTQKYLLHGRELIILVELLAILFFYGSAGLLIRCLFLRSDIC